MNISDKAKKSLAKILRIKLSVTSKNIKINIILDNKTIEVLDITDLISKFLDLGNER